MTNEALNHVLENMSNEKENIQDCIDDCHEQLNKINVRLHKYEGEMRAIDKAIVYIKQEIGLDKK